MWQSLLVYNACPQPQTEATVLVSPSLLQIDTFGKWCRCLHNVCYLKLEKSRYLDKCGLSAPADSTGLKIAKSSQKSALEKAAKKKNMVVNIETGQKVVEFNGVQVPAEGLGLTQFQKNPGKRVLSVSSAIILPLKRVIRPVLSAGADNLHLSRYLRFFSFR